jgi:DNA-binding CsgD family transcriptional regulator
MMKAQHVSSLVFVFWLFREFRPPEKELPKFVSWGQRNRLSAREIECLLWCGKGKTNAQIGAILGLSARTVEHYLASAIRKLEATNRTHAVYLAATAGLLKSEK